MKRKKEDGAYWVMRRESDRQILEWALEQAGGHVARAAAILEINKSYLYTKLKELGINAKEFKRQLAERNEPPKLPPDAVDEAAHSA